MNYRENRRELRQYRRQVEHDFRQYQRMVERDLRRDRPKLLQALQEFANIPDDKNVWATFRKRWPNFFPEDEYDKVAKDSKLSICSYPYWLHQIWIGGERAPHLEIMLGLMEAPVDGTPEDAWVADLSSIPAKFSVEWDQGVFCYEGGCDFQRALYLLFRESWRARICEKCHSKFIAKRAAQRFCTTDCSENMQRELKRKWWAEHGEAWRRERKESKRKRKGRRNGPRKTR